MAPREVSYAPVFLTAAMSVTDVEKPDWAHIDTVLLDLDGTLLDLAYDNHFWLEIVPAA